MSLPIAIRVCGATLAEDVRPSKNLGALRRLGRAPARLLPKRSILRHRSSAQEAKSNAPRCRNRLSVQKFPFLEGTPNPDTSRCARCRRGSRCSMAPHPARRCSSGSTGIRRPANGSAAGPSRGLLRAGARLPGLPATSRAIRCAQGS
jgi:hypothetical protein